MSKKDNDHIENDSFFIPFEMPSDSYFDHDHDGKLTGWETFERDSFYYNISQQYEKSKNDTQNSHIGEYKEIPGFDNIDRPKKPAPADSGSGAGMLLATFGGLFVIIITLILGISSGNILVFIIGIAVTLAIFSGAGLVSWS